MCYWTCTMLMGLPDTGISSDRVFGFHGPRSFGRSPDTGTFKHALDIIARNSAGPLPLWYMAEARFKLRGGNISHLSSA